MENKIRSAEELNNTVQTVVDYIKRFALEHPLSGNRHMCYEDIAHLISKDDYLKYLPLVLHELEARQSKQKPAAKHREVRE